MDAVHHKTYERVGREDLSDLMAICDPCHEFLSGKTVVDPLSDGVGVYLAGSFSLDWRRELLTTVGATNGAKMICNSGFVMVPKGIRGGFDATGPWKINNQHGGDSHGVLTAGHGGTFCACCNKAEVVALCKSAIRRSDIIFVWLPDVASVPAGTLWEMGYATALEKLVVVARPSKPTDNDWPDDDAGDYWFPMAASSGYLYHPTAAEAWEEFCTQDWPILLNTGRFKRASQRPSGRPKRTLAIVRAAHASRMASGRPF